MHRNSFCVPGSIRSTSEYVVGNFMTLDTFIHCYKPCSEHLVSTLRKSKTKGDVRTIRSKSCGDVDMIRTCAGKA